MGKNKNINTTSYPASGNLCDDPFVRKIQVQNKIIKKILVEIDLQNSSADTPKPNKFRILKLKISKPEKQSNPKT